MRRLASIIFVVLLFGAAHMALMSPAMGHEGMTVDCPMGFVCPLADEELRDLAVFTVSIAFPFFAVITIAFVAARAFAAYHPPAFVRVDTGPRQLLSVFKRE